MRKTRKTPAVQVRGTANKTNKTGRAVRGELGADGVLVGETLMRASDKQAALAELRGGH